MLDSYFLLNAMSGIPDEQVLLAEGVLSSSESRPQRRIRRNIGSAILVAAIIISLLGITAYALGLFQVQPTELKADPEKEQSWIFTDSEGNEISWGDHFDHGFSFRFSGDAAPHKVEFHPGWLPQEPTFWWPDPDAGPDVPFPEWDAGKELWLEYLLNERQSETDFFPEPGIHDVGIPYLITVEYAYKDHYLVFNGECEIIKHETWDQYEIYELSCQKESHLPSGVTDRERVISPENYVLMFSLEEGHMINIGGTSDLETLEHIARDLEIRTTGEVLEFEPGLNTTLINIALG